MKYVVTIAGHEHVIDVSAGGVYADGENVAAELVEIDGTPCWLLTLGDKRLTLALRTDGPGRYIVWTDRYRHDVEVVDERTRSIREMAQARGASTGPAPLVAPMPGMIIRVNVSAGDAVRAGQGLVVMEAMKMENELRATGAGTVRAIRVSPGTAVEKGTVLVELE